MHFCITSAHGLTARVKGAAARSDRLTSATRKKKSCKSSFHLERTERARSLTKTLMLGFLLMLLSSRGRYITIIKRFRRHTETEQARLQTQTERIHVTQHTHRRGVTAAALGSPCSFFSVSQNFCSSVKYLSRMNTLERPSVAMAGVARASHARPRLPAARTARRRLPPAPPPPRPAAPRTRR